MVLSCLPGASQAVRWILSCLFSASVPPCQKQSYVPRGQSVLRAANCGGLHPPQDLPRIGPFAIEIVLTVIQNPTSLQNRDSIGKLVRRVSLVPPRCFPRGAHCSFLPPWCLAGCPIDPFLPPWCLPGCPIGSFLPPWCLAGCPIDPFLPP